MSRQSALHCAGQRRHLGTAALMWWLCRQAIPRITSISEAASSGFQTSARCRPIGPRPPPPRPRVKYSKRYGVHQTVLVQFHFGSPFPLQAVSYGLCHCRTFFFFLFLSFIFLCTLAYFKDGKLKLSKEKRYLSIKLNLNFMT